MKHLQTIQKTFHIFEILSRVAMILSLVWAGLCLAGVLCAVVWYTGGTVPGDGQELVQALTSTSGLGQMLGVLLSDLVTALTEGILFLMAWRYFRAEQVQGTPFTDSGAEQLKRLGINTILMPLVATILSAVIYGCFDLSPAGNGDNFPSVILGIALILASLIFRYGAELEAKTSVR